MRSPSSASSTWTCRQHPTACGARSRRRARRRPPDEAFVGAGFAARARLHNNKKQEMTQLTSQATSPGTDVLTASRASETKLVASVCFAHLVSHYFIVLLAPLFVFIRADYGVSYTELGLALTAFGAVSAVL